MAVFDGMGTVVTKDPGEGTFEVLPDGKVIRKCPPVEVSTEQQLEMVRHLFEDRDLTEHHANIRTLTRLYKEDRLPRLRSGTRIGVVNTRIVDWSLGTILL